MSVSLDTLQSAFQAKLLSNSDDIMAHLSGGGPFMSVYEDGYTLRLLQVLAEDFGAVHSLLGDEKFETAMRAYLSDHPSRWRSVRWLGAELAAWLGDTAPWDKHKQLADTAAFEWALGLSFDGPDGDVLAVSSLGEIAPNNWPNLVFDFHPSLHLVDLDWDVVPFQQAIKAEQDPDGAPTPFAKPVTWATWRHPQHLSVYHRVLEDNEVDVLKSAVAGTPFSTLCEMLAEKCGGDESAVLAAGLLAQWVNSGWISNATILNAST